jgi:hypothetical protein
MKKAALANDIYDVDEESGTGKLTEYPYAGAGRRMQSIGAALAAAEQREGEE